MPRGGAERRTMNTETPSPASLAVAHGSGDCPTCAAKIPGWWVRGYCAACGGDLPQTLQQIEIERLRDALSEIDDVTGFDYPTMPESGRAKAHEITREIVLRALTRQNTDYADQICR